MADQHPEPIPNDATVLSHRPPGSDLSSNPRLVRGVRELGADLEGTLLGHFHLEKFVGGGGMGAVFRGVDTRLGRIVAVKVLPAPASSLDPTSQDTVRRFQNEAQSAARLDHPNIARVYYVGEQDGLNYIVFEYIDGENLRDLVVANGPLALEDVIDFAAQLTQALEHAAERGVVHRDIKPSNVLVTADRRIKLVDMGLARLHQVDAPQEDLTATGVTLGTFDYVSPEQARDPRSADVRSDLYSLGCTLFFMLTGRPPFPEGTVLQKLLSHSSDPPPDLRTFRPDLPHDVNSLVQRLLVKQPSRRVQTPRELAGLLADLAEQLGFSAPVVPQSTWLSDTTSPQSSWLRHGPWLVVATALIAIVTWIEFRSSHDRTRTTAPVRPTFAAPTETAPSSGRNRRTAVDPLAVAALRTPVPAEPATDGGTPGSANLDNADRLSPERLEKNERNEPSNGDKKSPGSGLAGEGNRAAGGPASGDDSRADNGEPQRGANDQERRSREPNDPEASPRSVSVSDSPTAKDVDPSSATASSPERKPTERRTVDSADSSPSTERTSNASESVTEPGGGRSDPNDTRPESTSREPTSREPTARDLTGTADTPVATGNSTATNLASGNSTGGNLSSGNLTGGGTTTGPKIRRLIVGSVDTLTPADRDARRFDSLKTAFRQAVSLPDVETIELRFDGERTEQPCDVSLAARHVTVRAGAGYQPVVRFAPGNSAPAVDHRLIRIVRSSLTWDRVPVVLVLPPDPSNDWALFELDHPGQVEWSNCTLTIRNVVQSGVPLHRAAFFQFVEPPPMETMMDMKGARDTTTPLITLRNCVARGQATLVRSPKGVPFRLTWQQGLFASSEGLIETSGARSQPLPSQGISVQLSQVTAAIGQPLCLMTMDAQSRFPLDLVHEFTNCIFLSTHSLATNPSPLTLFEMQWAAGLEPTRKRPHLSGSGNFYPNDAVLLKVLNVGQENALAEYTLRDRDQARQENWLLEQPSVGMVMWKQLRHDRLSIDQATQYDFQLDDQSNNPARSAGFDPEALPVIIALESSTKPAESPSSDSADSSDDSDSARP